MLCLGRPLHNLSLQLPSPISSFFYFFYVRHSLSVFFFFFPIYFFLYFFPFPCFLLFLSLFSSFPHHRRLRLSLDLSRSSSLSLDLSAAQQRADGGAGPPWRRRGSGARWGQGSGGAPDPTSPLSRTRSARPVKLYPIRRPILLHGQIQRLAG